MIAPATLAAAAVLALYAGAIRRYNRRHPAHPFPAVRAAAFALGVATAAGALGPPLDPASVWFLSAHMAQHLLLMLVAAPLLLVGTPVRLARQSGVPAVERLAARVAHSRLLRAATWPPAAWGLFAAVLAGSHFSPLYEAALEHPAVHVLEHAMYLAAALLFWSPVVGLEPSPWRMGYGLRLLYVAAAVPVQSFIGLAIYSARHILYPHYALVTAVRGAPASAALADQQAGGVIMWVGGGLPMVAALLLVAAAWAAEERRLADHLDGAERSSRISPSSATATPIAPTSASHQP